MRLCGGVVLRFVIFSLFSLFLTGSGVETEIEIEMNGGMGVGVDLVVGLEVVTKKEEMVCG